MRRTIAIPMFVATLILAVLGVLLTTANSDWIANLIFGSWLCLFGAIALVIVLRMPDNAVGILMLSFAAAGTLSLAAASYGQYVYEFGHPDLPFGDIAAWLSLWLPLPSMGLLLFVFLRFPNGELLSARWRHVERLVILALASGAVALAFRPGPVDSVRVSQPRGFGEANLPNPFGIEAWERVAAAAETVGQVLLMILAFATLASLIMRFRRSGDVQRRQMKSFVLSTGLLPAFFILGQLIGVVDPTEEQVFAFLVVMLGAFLVPVGMGVAILKYRLYDIELIVNRTLVYGAVTTLLVGSYVALVVALQFVLDPIRRDSDLAVAASTLAVAALFRPLRSGVQRFIDRRFYRRRYDASRTLETLAGTLRDEVDLSAVQSEIVSVVNETIQPAHVALWLREENTS